MEEIYGSLSFPAPHERPYVIGNLVTSLDGVVSLGISGQASGKEIVELEPQQVANFAGNAIELHDARSDKLLVVSARAMPTFTEGQRAVLRRHVRFIPLELPTIELGGGSARCMIATIHLPLL